MMSLKDSRFLEVLRLCRRKGFGQSLIAVASKIARRYSGTYVDLSRSLESVLDEETPACLQPSASGPLRLNWILPEISAGQGGLLNIFRTIQQLERWNHDNRIYLAGRVPGGPAAARDLIIRRYFPIRAEVEVLSDEIRDCDALLATNWVTAYAARSIGNTAAKFYFVQDLEYMFYAPGSLYELARQTYRFGFHGITLGPWIAEVLRNEFKMECSPFGFSYDRESYGHTGTRLAHPPKRRLLFYARPETERRGFELGILALSIVAKKMPDVEVILVGFAPRAVDLPFSARVLGVLPVAELAALYRSCDVALVLSHTNLSMLPLELMASGCAVVSNGGPNVEWLLTEEVAQLAMPDPESLAKAILQLLESEALRMRKIQAGKTLAESTDWKREIRNIETALFDSQKSHSSEILKLQVHAHT